MDTKIVCGLTGTELEYALAKAMGYEMLGSKKGPFVLHSTPDAAIYVFGGSKDSVSFPSFAGDFADVPLQKGQELGATMSIENGVAKCRLQGLCVDGKDYLQALMRALVIHLNTEKEKSMSE